MVRGGVSAYSFPAARCKECSSSKSYACMHVKQRAWALCTTVLQSCATCHDPVQHWYGEYCLFEWLQLPVNMQCLLYYSIRCSMDAKHAHPVSMHMHAELLATVQNSCSSISAMQPHPPSRHQQQSHPRRQHCGKRRGEWRREAG
jgi:hypothetical protein